MPFAPDIVVTTQDTPRLLLIVEAKLASRIRSQDESQLKSYMLQMRCPIGLLVTPDEIVVYRVLTQRTPRNLSVALVLFPPRRVGRFSKLLITERQDRTRTWRLASSKE